VYKNKFHKAPVKIESDGTFKSASELLVKNEEQENAYVIHTMKWGIPINVENGVKPIINARSESFLEKPMFKRLMVNNRCVVFIDGYYEWQNAALISPTKGKGLPKKTQRQIYFIHPRNGIKKEEPQEEHELLCLAGLYESRTVKKEGKDETEYYFTVVTLASMEEMSSIHDRVPAILTTKEDIENWLGDGGNHLKAIKHPAPHSLQLKKVNEFVSRAGNDGVRCIESKTESKGTLHAFFSKTAVKKEAPKRKADEIKEEETSPKKMKLESEQ
jgi:putative SOS response-associated peptidase YedK